ncbi:hypothetical protein RYX36_011981 [Vicia faba]
MSSMGNQGKHSLYAAGSSSQSHQSDEAEHLEFDNTRFIGPHQQASGRSLGSKAPTTLGFPALIMGLCRKESVDIPNVATKRISSIMNDDYMLRHCVPNLAGEAAPQPQAHVPSAGPAPFNEQQACVYNWQMMEAQMRASFFLHDYMQLFYRH